MKSIAWLLLLLVSILRAEADVVDTNSVETPECSMHFDNITTDMVSMFFDSPPLNRTYSCMAACYLKRNNAMDAKNYISGEAFLNIYESFLNSSNVMLHDLLKTAVDNCTASQTVERDECLAVENFSTCFDNLCQDINVKVVDMCAANISNSKMTNFQKSIFLMRRVPENRREACLGACFLKVYGLMNDANKFRVQRLLNFYSRPMSKFQKPLLAECNEEINEIDECIAYKKFMECNTKEINSWRKYDAKNIAALHYCSDDYLTSEKLELLRLSSAPSNREDNCLGACYLKNMSIMDSQNRIYATEIIKMQRKHYEEEFGPKIAQKVIKMVHECEEEQTIISDECKSFQNYLKCVEMKITQFNMTEFVLNKCLEEYDVPEEDRNDIISLKRAPTTKSESCLGYCFTNEYGLINNAIVRKKFSAMYEMLSYEKIVKCAPDEESKILDKCIAWETMVKCLLKN